MNSGKTDTRTHENSAVKNHVFINSFTGHNRNSAYAQKIKILLHLLVKILIRHLLSRNQLIIVFQFYNN